MKKDGNGSRFLPRKLPIISRWKTSEEDRVKMSDSEVNTRLFFAATVGLFATIFVSLRGKSTATVYAYLFTVANLAGYTYTLNANRNCERFPVLAASAKAVMLAAGFTATTALAYNQKLPLTLMRNIVVHGAVFLLLTIALLPKKVTEKL